MFITRPPVGYQSMIRKSGYRFFEKIMLKQNRSAMVIQLDPITLSGMF